MPALGREIGRDEKTARRAVHALIAAGWLEVVETKPGKPRRYRVHSTPLPRMTPPKNDPSQEREAHPSQKCPSTPPKDGRQKENVKREAKRDSFGHSANGHGRDERFQEFWEQHWPKRVAKKAARKAFHKHIRTEADLEKLKRIAAVYEERQWRHTERHYTPHLSSFLNGNESVCWTDNPSDIPDRGMHTQRRDTPAERMNEIE
jgi:DNA-binding transcriptional regulator PaaX